MFRINKIISIALPIALIAVLLIPGCGGKADGGSEGEKGSGMRPVTRVRVMEITQEPFIKKVHLLGMARAVERALGEASRLGTPPMVT